MSLTFRFLNQLKFQKINSNIDINISSVSKISFTRKLGLMFKNFTQIGSGLLELHTQTRYKSWKNWKNVDLVVRMWHVNCFTSNLGAAYEPSTLNLSVSCANLVWLVNYPHPIWVQFTVYPLSWWVWMKKLLFDMIIGENITQVIIN